MKMLVDSVVAYQERSQTIIAEMRQLATKNSEEIREAVEDGKRRLTALVEQGAAAALIPNDPQKPAAKAKPKAKPKAKA